MAGLLPAINLDPRFEALVGRSGWIQTDGFFVYPDKPPALELPAPMRADPELTLWRSWSPETQGTLGTLRSAPFDAPRYLAIPHVGFAGERPGMRILLRCLASGSELDVATLRTNTQWATAYLDPGAGFCAGQVELVAQSTERSLYIGVGTPYAVSAAVFHGQRGMAPRALVVLGTWAMLLCMLFVTGGWVQRFWPAVDPLAGGFVAVGLVGIAVVLLFAIDATAARSLVRAGTLALVVLALRRWWQDPAGCRRQVAVFVLPAVLWLALAMGYVALTVAADGGGGSWSVNGLFTPLRWSSDNQLPMLTAEMIYHGTRQADLLISPWFAYDRTPLLAGLLLVFRSTLFEPLLALFGSAFAADAYMVTGAVILASWVIVLHRLVRGLESRWAAFVLALAATSGFFLFNSVYIWPKLLGAVYGVLAFHLLWGLYRQHAVSTAVCTAAALCAALAHLSHASNDFGLVPIAALFMATLWRQGLHRLAVAAVAAMLLAGAWTWWVASVQPGADALLRYALTGVLDFSQRGQPLWPAIREAYEQMGLVGWVQLKASELLRMAGWLGQLPEVAESSPGIGTLGDARVAEFFGVLRTLGLSAPGLVLLVVTGLRSRTGLRPGSPESSESSEALQLARAMALAGGLGILFMLLTTLAISVTHTQPYVSVVLLIGAGALVIARLPRLVRSGVLATSLIYFVVVWVLHPLLIAERLGYGPLLVLVEAALLGATLLVLIAREDRSSRSTL